MSSFPKSGIVFNGPGNLRPSLRSGQVKVKVEVKVEVSH
jgi:hypothetical protein